MTIERFITNDTDTRIRPIYKSKALCRHIRKGHQQDMIDVTDPCVYYDGSECENIPRVHKSLSIALHLEKKERECLIHAWQSDRLTF